MVFNQADPASKLNHQLVISSLGKKWTKDIGRMPMPRGIGFQPMNQNT
jgi:hypothetical protein